MQYSLSPPPQIALDGTLRGKFEFPGEIQYTMTSHLIPHLEDDFLERHVKLNTLRSLSLTNRAWHHATYDHFHHTIQVAPTGSCHPYGVLSRLAAQPRLVRFVKEVSITHYPLTNPPRKLTDEELMRIVDTLHVSDELRESLKLEIHVKGIPQCTLLPALCNRLEVLQMKMPSSFGLDPPAQDVDRRCGWL